MKKLVLFFMLIMACFIFLSCEQITNSPDTNETNNSDVTDNNSGDKENSGGTITPPNEDNSSSENDSDVSNKEEDDKTENDDSSSIFPSEPSAEGCIYVSINGEVKNAKYDTYQAEDYEGFSSENIITITKVNDTTIKYSKNYKVEQHDWSNIGLDLLGDFEKETNYKVTFDVKSTNPSRMMFELPRDDSKGYNEIYINSTTDWQTVEVYTGKFSVETNKYRLVNCLMLVDKDIDVYLTNIKVEKTTTTDMLKDLPIHTYSSPYNTIGYGDRAIDNIEGKDVFRVGYNTDKGEMHVTHFPIDAITESGLYKVSARIKFEKPGNIGFSLNDSIYDESFSTIVGYKNINVTENEWIDVELTCGWEKSISDYYIPTFTVIMFDGDNTFYLDGKPSIEKINQEDIDSAGVGITWEEQISKYDLRTIPYFLVLGPGGGGHSGTVFYNNLTAKKLEPNIINNTDISIGYEGDVFCIDNSIGKIKYVKVYIDENSNAVFENATLDDVEEYKNTYGGFYKVTLDLNGGNFYDDSLPVEYILPLNTNLIWYLDRPHKENYYFYGWTYTKDGTDYISDFGVNDGKTIYAKWVDYENSPVITFDLNGGEIDGNTNSIDVKIPYDNWFYNYVNFESTVTKDGYVLIGWSISRDGTDDISYNDKKEDYTVYAKWKSVNNLFLNGYIYGSFNWDGILLTQIDDETYTASFDYSEDYGSVWLNVRAVDDDWSQTFGANEELIVDGDELLIGCNENGIEVNNLIDGVEYKVTVKTKNGITVKIETVL